MLSYVILTIDYVISKHFHDKDFFEEFPGRALQKNKYLCVFSHYDANNIIDPYVLFYLQELARCGCDIVFVTTSSSLSIVERDKIAPYCKKIIVRQNRGRDFGAFKCGIHAIENISQYEKLILANDSVYGPIFALNEVLLYGEKNNLDIWGSSSSLQKSYHIQSYFVVFNQCVLKNSAFSTFWKRVHYFGHRQNIINHYEIGMSTYFLKQGFKLGALCDYGTVKQRILSDAEQIKKIDKKTQLLLKYPLNPTHFFWDIMIADYRFPFIKRELLVHNPEKLNISNWMNLLKTYSDFDVSLITHHLSRLSKQVST